MCKCFEFVSTDEQRLPFASNSCSICVLRFPSSDEYRICYTQWYFNIFVSFSVHKYRFIFEHFKSINYSFDEYNMDVGGGRGETPKTKNVAEIQCNRQSEYWLIQYNTCVYYCVRVLLRALNNLPLISAAAATAAAADDMCVYAFFVFVSDKQINSYNSIYRIGCECC